MNDTAQIKETIRGLHFRIKNLMVVMNSRIEIMNLKKFEVDRGAFYGKRIAENALRISELCERIENLQSQLTTMEAHR